MVAGQEREWRHWYRTKQLPYLVVVPVLQSLMFGQGWPNSICLLLFFCFSAHDTSGLGRSFLFDVLMLNLFL
jgi:hypothetical protein